MSERERGERKREPERDRERKGRSERDREKGKGRQREHTHRRALSLCRYTDDLSSYIPIRPRLALGVDVMRKSNTRGGP